MKRILPPRSVGFSLVELMVASALIAVLMLLLVSIADRSTEAWAQAERRVEALREARAALQIFVRDVRGIKTLQETPSIFFNRENASAINITPDSEIIKTADGSDTFFFVSSQPQNAQDTGQNRSDLCLIGYYLMYTLDRNQQTRSCKLYRHLTSSNDTFQKLKDVIGGGSTTLVNAFVTPFGAPGDEPIARNVRQFDLKLFRRNQEGQLQEQTDWPTSEMPAAVDVSISVLRNDTAKRLTNKASWISPGTLAESNEMTISTRIVLPNSR